MFVLSDTPEGCFSLVGATEISAIFTLGKPKTSLEKNERKFAVDELEFSVDQLTTSNTDEENACYFVLDASNLNKNRFCAVFYDSSPASSSCVFFGKINSDFKASDLIWSSEDYGSEIDPSREYKFSAAGFDISILKICKFTETIEDQTGTGTIDNIYDRLSASDYSSVKAICDWRQCFAYQGGEETWKIAYLAPLANLYKVVRLYLDCAESLLSEYFGTTYVFNLPEKSFGYRVVPAVLERTDDLPIIGVGTVRAQGDTDKPEVKFRNSDSHSETETSLYIHRRMIEPSFGNDLTYEWQKDLLESEDDLSFKGYEDMSEFISKIARAIGCYPKFSYVGSNEIDVEFLPYGDIPEAGKTYITVPEKADLDSSSVLESGKAEFYGIINRYADEGSNNRGNNVIKQKIGLSSDIIAEFEPSYSYKEHDGKREQQEDNKEAKYERLAFCTGFATVHARLASYAWSAEENYLLNTTTDNSLWSQKLLPCAYGTFSQNKDLFYRQAEMLSTQLYMRARVPEDHGDVFPTGDEVWRPAVKVLTRVAGEDRDFNSMSDLVSHYLSRSKHYYETEYKLTVPTWNGFSKNADGSSPGWDKLQLGSVITLSEIVKNYDGSWTSGRVSRDFVVVGIERSLDEPETVIELHNVERFAYTDWAGSNEDIEELILHPQPSTPQVVDETTYTQAEVDESEIKNGNAVYFTSDGKIKNSYPHSEIYGRTKGVAMSDGTLGQIISVRTGGVHTCDEYDFANVGVPVYVRRPSVGETLNLSESILTEPTAEDDSVIQIGITLSVNSILIVIDEMVFLEGVTT